jgi:amino acid adenylation domain-containing protein
MLSFGPGLMPGAVGQGAGRRLRPSACFQRFPEADIDQAISARFEQQVARFPDQVAVKTPNGELTYVALNRLANRLARAILDLRAERQQTVALLLEKEAYFPAAILGALKAGKIYVPLSPSYPTARNALLLEDSGAELVITDRQNLAAATALASERRIPLANIEALEPSLEGTNLGLPISPADYAYIIYTSGTTGRPKGVVESHRNLLHNMMNYTNDLFLAADDRLICLGCCAFSSILKDIYGALLNGATLCPFDVQREGISRLGSWMAEHGITIYDSVPTVFRHFLGSLEGAEDLSRIRVVRLGGETITRTDIDLFRKHFSAPCVLVNGYGATETGTASLFTVGMDVEIEGSVMPIGYPVAGMEIRLLGDDGQEVAAGEVGQIAVRSEYLAHGYWQQPELTDRAFLQDPKADARRIYLTGDMGRRSPDGCLTCVGRKDTQVKVRGHRIELTEIELKLLEFGGVKEAVVQARPELRRENCLAAYVVPRDGCRESLSPARLRAFLQEQLPAYAIPAAIVLLESLPTTPNGKFDPKALPAVTPRDLVTERRQTHPRNPLESQVLGILQELLETPWVGMQDNFFELGGDSLTAVELIVRIRKAFCKELPIAALLHAGTAERIARLLEEDCASQTRRSLVTLQADGTKPPLFFVHAIGGEVLCYRHLAQCLGKEQPFFAFQSLDKSKVGGRLLSIEEMAARYVDELLCFQDTGPYHLAGYSLGGVIAYEMAQQLRGAGHDVPFLAVIDQRRPNLTPGSQWNPISAANCLRNLPNWVREDLLHAGLGDVVRRLRRKWSVLRRRLGNDASAMDVPDYFALDALPANFRMLAQENYRALRSYTPRPYPGKMFLFRASAQPLSPGDWHKTDMGWHGLPRGGLMVRTIPGNHDSILRDPYVRALAQELHTVLATHGKVAPPERRRRRDAMATS